MNKCRIYSSGIPLVGVAGRLLGASAVQPWFSGIYLPTVFCLPEQTYHFPSLTDPNEKNVWVANLGGKAFVFLGKIHYELTNSRCIHILLTVVDLIFILDKDCHAG
jgi:hypothetical protein